MALKENLEQLKTIENKVVQNKVANFCYEESAYTNNDVDGVTEYDAEKPQNIPVATPDVMMVNETVLKKGYRSQASSMTRMFLNHMLGRASYNLNKVNDIMSAFLDNIITSLGSANGIASLDGNAHLPVHQGGTVAGDTKSALNNLTANVTEDTDTYNDNTRIVHMYELPSAQNGALFFRKVSSLWSYLKSKFDTTPTENSTNAVTSGGVYSSIVDAKDLSKATGILAVAHGGTNSDNSLGANYNLMNSAKDETSNATGDTYIASVHSSASSSNGYIAKRKLSTLANYIRGLFSGTNGISYSSSTGAFTVSYGSSANTVCQGNDARLSNARTPTSHASSSTTYGASDATNYGHAKASSTTPKASGTESVGNETSSFARGDHVHPYPAQIATTRYIDGVGFNGNANVYHFGTCSTSASTAAKTVSCSNFTLDAGSRISVLFSSGHTSTVSKTGNLCSASITLNVNSTGAKYIKVGNEYVGENWVNAGDVHDFVYDGTYWIDVTSDVIYRGSSGSNYYIKHRSGLIEQTVYWTSANPNTTVTYTLLIPFTNALYNAQVTEFTIGGAGFADGTVTIRGKTTTTVSVGHYTSQGGTVYMTGY